MATTFTSQNGKMTLTINDTYTCNNEEYLNNTYQFSGHSYTYYPSNNDYGHSVYTSCVRDHIDNTYKGGRNAIYIINTSESFGFGTVIANSASKNVIILYGGDGISNSTTPPDVNQTWIPTYAVYPHSYWSYSGNYDSSTCEFATNIPVFETYEDANNYVNNGGDYIKNAINYEHDYYRFDIPVGTTGNTYSAKINMDTYACDGITYLFTPKFYYDEQNYQPSNYPYVEDRVSAITISGRSEYGYRAAISIEDIISRGRVWCYETAELSPSYLSWFSGEGGQSNSSWSAISFSSYSTTTIPQICYAFTSQYVGGINNFEIATNVPVFATNAQASQYLADGSGIENAVNYRHTTQLPFYVTTGAGASATLIIDIGRYNCDGVEYLTTPRVYCRYKAHNIYGWYVKSEVDTVQGSAGQSLYNYRVAYSMTEILRVGNFRGGSDPYTPMYGGAGLETENKEGHSQSGYEYITLTTYNNCTQIPYNELDYNDSRIDSCPELIFSTNAPIFKTDAEVFDYIRYGTGIENAINYESIYPDAEGTEYLVSQLSLLRRRLMKNVE